MDLAAVPPLLDTLANVTFPARLEQLRSFFAGPAKEFRIHLDAACGLPTDWRASWDAPSQWGVTGNAHWATKYGAQGFIPRMVDNSPFVTSDWRSASASIVVLFARHYAGGPAIVQQQCLQRLRARSEAFRATNGSRHFFIFTDSRGPCCLDGKYKDVDFLRHHVIGPHGEPASAADEWFFRRGKQAPRIRCFDATKDINIPTPNIHWPRTPFAPNLPRRPLGPGSVLGVPRRPAPAARTLLLFYAGWNYGVRMELVRMYERDADTDVVVRRRVSKKQYMEHMSSAKFCPVCGGFSQWTPRLAEALYYGCVPVILSPQMQEPWARLLDWSRFSVRLEPTHANLRGLKQRLRGLDYESLAHNVRHARAALRYRLDKYDGHDMLPLLLHEMHAVLQTPIGPPAGVSQLSNTVETDRDYNVGLQNVHSQRKAHSVETHAALALPGGEQWDCASFDGYMCECRKRDASGVPHRAHRCRGSGACYDR